MGAQVSNRKFVNKRSAEHSLTSVLKVLTAVVIAASLTGATTPAPSPAASLRSGLEGAKAALVRIEHIAVAEIAHIDHTTGEVEIRRGRSVVPLKSATGILLSADGIVATTWESLAGNEPAVAVYAANELFASKMHVPIVGNNGNVAQRGSTPDPYWKPHLQHCYDQVTHCVLFSVAQYHVRTYTSKPADVIAELLNRPTKPDDVALLRISGGGAAPTAPIAAASTSKTDAVLMGFTQRPGPKVAPAELPVRVDATGARIRSMTNAALPQGGGLAGGAVVDRVTGQILGLAGSRQPDGKATLITAAGIRSAVEKAGLKLSPSRFDAVFRRGIDHLSAGNQGGSAESALEESLTYFDSALAANRLAQARALGAKDASTGQAQASEDKNTPSLWPVPTLPILAGALLLTIVVGALVLRRRTASAAASSAVVSTPTAHDPPASVPLAAATSAGNHSRASVERTELTKAATGKAERITRGRSDSIRTDAGEHHMPAHMQATASPVTPPTSRLIPNTEPSMKPDADETRLAGPLAPRAFGEVPTFCFQCGRQLEPEWRFCVSCGRRIG
jgi:hypothetical protein